MGTACDGTGTLLSLRLRPGYYRASLLSTDVRLCPDYSAGRSASDSACIGSGPWLGTCRPWTSGPYCRLCNVSDGSRYYDADQSACLLCEGSTTAPVAVISTVIAIVLLLLLWCVCRKPWRHVPPSVRNRWRKTARLLLLTLRAPLKQMIAFNQASPKDTLAP